MDIIVLPFGAPAWERRKQIIRDIIESRPGPPYDYRDVLYLVPNERTVKTLRRLFLDVLEDATGAKACIPPDVSALNRLISRKAKSAARRPVVEEMARGLALEEICRKAAGELDVPGMNADVLGPSLAPMLGDALDMLYKYGVAERAVSPFASDSLPVKLLLKSKKEYEKWLDRHGLADLYYPDRYAPGTGEFASYRRVVLDGFYDADPAELSVLKALASAPGCTFLIEAPGLSKDSVQEGMPYMGTDRLLAELGSDVAVMSADKAGAEADALSGAVFGGRRLHDTETMIKGLSGWSSDIRVVGALSPAEEAGFIAGSIKDLYRERQIDLNRVLVFFPDQDTYLPLIEDAFGDLGIPYHVSQGRLMMRSPVVKAFLDAASLPLDKYPYRGMRRVFSSRFIQLAGGGNAPDMFDAFARKAGITGGRGRWLDGLARACDPETEAVLRPRMARLFSATGPFEAKAQPLSAWCQAAAKLINDCGLTGTVEGMDGSRPELKDALDGLTGILDEMRGAASRLKGTVGLPEFLYMVRKSLSGRRCRPGREMLSGVRVLGALETLSEPFDVIYAGGLAEGSMPRAGKPDIFFTPEISKKLGLPGDAEQRAREARLFMGLALGAKRVFLCYPESSDGSPVSPSPYIRALEPFFEAGVIQKSQRVCRALEPGRALGPSAYLRALAFNASLAGIKEPELQEALDVLPDGAPGLDRARIFLSAPTPGSAPRPPEKKKFRVTELEEYILCHYRYYHDQVAKSAPPDEPEDDVAPHRAGSIIHEILRDFYEGRENVTASTRDEALTKLVSIADGKFRYLPDTAANRELKRRFIGFLAPRFIEEEIALTGTGSRVCATETPIEIEVDDPEAGHIVITGKIDRIELGRGGDFTVADYKTGRYTTTRGELFQLPLYAYMLMKKPEVIGASGSVPRPTGFVYYNLKEGTMRDEAAYDEEAAPESLLKKSPKRKLLAKEMKALVDGAYDKAMEAVRGILAGRFEPTCAKDFVCQRCIYAAVCTVGKKAGDAEPEDGAKGAGDEED